MTADPRPRRPAKGACPVCRKPAGPAGPFAPFCTERCKMVDLGRWFRGEYVVAGEDAIALDPEELEEHFRQIEADRARRAVEGGEAESDG